MTLDEFREKCCRLCGTQRCTGDGEWLNGCPHYHREVLGEADYEDPAMKAVREYLENRIAESPVNERKQPNCDNCIWHPSGIAEGISHERLREITDAERDGRLVVLPCKVGDTLYYPYAKRVIEKRVTQYRELLRKSECIDKWLCVDFSNDETFEADDIGKTIFLTRAEAEAALKGERHEAD